MTEQSQPHEPFIVLSPEQPNGRIVVDLHALVQFGMKISADLAQLEERFAKFARVRPFGRERIIPPD